MRKVPELKVNDYLNGSKKDRENFIKDLYKGLVEYGFFIIKDNPISKDLLEKTYKLNKEYFKNNSEYKNKHISKNFFSQRGFTPFGVEHAKDSDKVDLKEFYHVGRELSKESKYKGIYPENIFPSEEHKAVWTEIYSELDKVSDILLEALTYSLDIKKDYFKSMTNDGNSILRILHYPPISADADPKCVRAAAHEDINLITILVAASASGLQLLDRDGKWLEIESDENDLIVDAGDMLSRITNNIIPSTTHRVVNPQDGKNSDRYSMPFFVHPHAEAMLSCIESCSTGGKKYEDILAKDFLDERLKDIGLKK